MDVNLDFSLQNDFVRLPFVQQLNTEEKGLGQTKSAKKQQESENFFDPTNAKTAWLTASTTEEAILLAMCAV